MFCTLLDKILEQIVRDPCARKQNHAVFQENSSVISSLLKIIVELAAVFLSLTLAF